MIADFEVMPIKTEVLSAWLDALLKFKAQQDAKKLAAQRAEAAFGVPVDMDMTFNFASTNNELGTTLPQDRLY